MLLQGDQTGITPSIARDPSKAKDMDTVAKLLAVTRLMGLMVTGPPSEDDPLFVSHRGQIIHLPSKMAEAESYVLEKGAKAKASEASERGITAGCLSSVVLKLLNDLDDVLCTGKVYAAFMAAVRITGYRERLYVMRLLLERVPADRMETLKNLVGVVANATSVEDGANAGGGGGVSLDFLTRVLAPRVMRKQGAPMPTSPGMSPTKPIPEKGAAAATDEAKVLDLFRTFVKERAYLIFKGDAISVIDTEAYAKSLKAAQDRERESRRESRASPAGRKSPNDSPSPGTLRRLKTTGGSGREIVTMSAQEEAEMEAKRAKRQRQAKTDRESGLRLTYMDPALPGGKRATPAAVFSEAQRLKEEEIYREAKTKALRKEAEREAKRKELVPELPPVTPTKTYSNLHDRSYHDRSYLQELREKRMVGKEVSPSKHDKGFDPTNPLRKVNRKTGGINASPPRHKSRVRAMPSPASAGPSQIKASNESNKPAPTVPRSPEPTKEAPEWMRGRDPAGSPLVSRAAMDRVHDMFAKSPDLQGIKKGLNQAFGSSYAGIEARPRPLVDGDRFTRHHRRDNHGTFRQPFVSRDNVQPTRDTLQDVVQPEALRRSAEKKPYVPRRLPLDDGSRVKKLLNMTPAGGLTRDEAQAAALKAKERELKSPGKKPRRPASIKELKAKIKLTDAKAIPVNDPGMDKLKGISARMRPKTATEAAAAAKAIPAQPAAAAAQAVPVQVLADVAIAAARVIGIAAGDAVPVTEGKPPRGPLAAYKGSALFPAAAGTKKKLKKKRIIPGISPVLREGADGVNPEDMVYYEGQGEDQSEGQDVDQDEGGEEEYEDADEYVDDEGAYEEGENEGGSPGSTGSFAGFIPAGGQAGSGRSTPGGPGDGRVSLPAGFRRAAPGTKGAVTARDAIASGIVAAGMIATDAGVDSGLLESDGADLSGTAGKGLRAGLRAARKHAAENSAAVARRAVGASARGPKGPNSKPSNRYGGGGGFRTGGAGSGPGLGRSKSLPTSGGVRAAAQQQQQHAGRPPAGGSTRLANTTVDQPSGSSRDRLQNVYAAGDAAFHGAAEPADADEYVKMYSRTSLERVLKEVAAMGGLDKFVDSENEDEDGDVNVTAEDMAQIINLVKMKRRERAGTMERGRKKTGGGLVGKMA